jgi:hypothetical protein
VHRCGGITHLGVPLGASSTAIPEVNKISRDNGMFGEVSRYSLTLLI